MFDHFCEPPRSHGASSITIVDVTLRDGGFEVDFDWPDAIFDAVPSCLSPFGVDFIEIGYIGGVPLEHKVAKPGMGAFITPRRLARIASVTTGLAAMIHPTALDTAIDLAAFRQAGLRMIRLVYHPKWFDQIVEIARHARGCDLIVTVNVALASRYASGELVEHVRRVVREAAPDVLYMADTCGAMLPGQVAELVRLLVASLDTAVGFHAHDFLSLGYANALAAVEAGAAYVDSSLLGLGRSGGNLETELVLIRHRMEGALDPEAVDALLRCRAHLGRIVGREARSLVPAVSGAANLTPVEEGALLKAAEQHRLDPSDTALRFLAAGARLDTLCLAEPLWAVP